jgi:hypothetical protein
LGDAGPDSFRSQVEANKRMLIDASSFASCFPLLDPQQLAKRRFSLAR